MFSLVTKETEPELAADSRNRWWSIANQYWQTDNNKGITLEIRHTENGKFRWWIYDDFSPEPDLAVTLDDTNTISEALTAVYDYLDSYKAEIQCNSPTATKPSKAD